MHFRWGIFIAFMSFVITMFLHCLAHFSLFPHTSIFPLFIPLSSNQWEIDRQIYRDYFIVMDFLTLFFSIPKYSDHIQILVFSCLLQFKSVADYFIFDYMCIETLVVSNWEFLIYWASVNKKVCNNVNFLFTPTQ